jgi:hypothetical protein
LYLLAEAYLSFEGLDVALGRIDVDLGLAVTAQLGVGSPVEVFPCIVKYGGTSGR